MGRSSVSEAPRETTTLAQVALRPVAASILFPSGPNSSRLVHADPNELRFATSSRVRAPILLCPLLVILAALPWLAGSVDSLRFGVSALFFLASLTIGARSWPRAVHSRLNPRSRKLHVGGQTLSVPEGSRFVLEQWHDDTRAPQGCYVAQLELPTGERFPLIQDVHPERVLDSLQRVLEHFPHPVECHWGLPVEAAPWMFERPRVTDSRPPLGQTLFRERVAGPTLVRLMAVTACLVVLDLSVLVTTQRTQLAYVHPLSIILPIIFGACLVALSLGLTSCHARLSIGTEVTTDINVFGSSHGARSRRADRVRDVYVIGHAAAGRRHLLLDTSDGPLAIAVRAAHADGLARSVTRAIAAFNRSGSATSVHRSALGA